MFSLTVLTSDTTAPGYRLAGVKVIEAQTSEAARLELTELLNDQKSGIIAIDESLAACIDARLQTKIDQLYRPVVVLLPASTTLAAQESRRMLIERLVKKAIGFDLKLG